MNQIISDNIYKDNISNKEKQIENEENIDQIDTTTNAPYTEDINELLKYFKMLQIVPEGAVRGKMTSADLDDDAINKIMYPHNG